MTENTKEKLIENILKIEWDMFSNVNNISGPAPCQKDEKTFRIMRSSQFNAWSERILQSYLDDLIRAEKAGENLMTLKYARMMQSTSPEEFALIKDAIPPVDPEKTAYIEKIVEISMEWENALHKRYPALTSRGRPIYSKEDSPYVTSAETYMKGELSTYSSNTLRRYHAFVLQKYSDGGNLYEEILLNTVKEYGFESLQQANDHYAQG